MATNFQTKRLVTGQDLPIAADLYTPEELARMGAVPQPLPTVLTPQQAAGIQGLNPVMTPQAAVRSTGAGLEAPALEREETRSDAGPVDITQAWQQRDPDAVGPTAASEEDVQEQLRQQWEGRPQLAESEGKPTSEQTAVAERPAAQPGMVRPASVQRAGGGSAAPRKDPLMEEYNRLKEEEANIYGEQLANQQDQMIATEKLRRAQIENEQLQAEAMMRDAERQYLAKEQIEEEVGRLSQKVSDTAQRASEMRVDPDRYWKNRGNFARALGALAIVIGARGSGENKGLQLINQAIDRDIKEQEFAVEQAWRANKAAKGQYAEYLQAFGSPKAAREALRATMLGNMEHEHKMRLLASGIPYEEAMNNSAIKQLRLARDQSINTAGQQGVIARLQQREIDERNRAAAAAAARKKAGELPSAERAVFDRNGKLVGWALKGEDVGQVRQELINFDQMDSWFGEYEKLSQTANAKVPGTAENQRVRALAGYITAAAQKSVYGTRMTDADQRSWEAATGDPRLILNAETVRRSRKAAQEMRENVVQGRIRGTPGGAAPAVAPKPSGVEEVE